MIFQMLDGIPFKLKTPFDFSFLSAYGNLENILQNAPSIPKPAIQEAILQDLDRLRTNYHLIKLTGEHPLPFPPEDLVFARKNFTTTKVLKGIGLR